MNDNPQNNPWWARCLDGLLNAIDWWDLAEGAVSLIGHALHGLLSALLGFLDGL